MFPAGAFVARCYRSRSCGGDVGLSLIELGAVVVVDDLDEGIAAANALEVLNQDALTYPGTLAASGVVSARR